MIIAEVGQNHCGDIILAKQLINYAKESGADLAKFQLYDHWKLYRHSNIPNCELSFEQAKILFKYGQDVGIEVFFSVFDAERVKWCEEIGVKRYKIAYNQWTNYALWKDLPDVIISAPYKIEGKTTLYCIPKYPAELNDLKFSNVSFDNFDGFSDHTIGLDAAKIALARGARIIEKHFSISHEVGIDGMWSMTPAELKELKQWEVIASKALDRQ